MLGPGTGTFTIGGTPINASNGVAIGNYTGSFAQSELDAATDTAALTGTGDVFALTLSSSASTLNPLQTTAFNTNIATNFADSFTTTVEALPGFAVSVTTSGGVTVQPPAGALPGQYAVLVTAQSNKYPRLFVSAIHLVTVNAFEGVSLSVDQDTLTTVPWGLAQNPAELDETNDGRPQVQGAAYHINITNTSNTTHTFTVNLSGLPAGWSLISGKNAGETSAQLVLPPGAPGQLGFYISPTLSSMPPAGTPYPFTVAVVATDNPSLTANQTVTPFTIPPIAYAYATLSPERAYAAPGGNVTLTLNVRNVGNTAGTFPIGANLPVTQWATSLPTNVTVGAGVTSSVPFVVDVTTGTLGSSYRVDGFVVSGPYTLTASADVRLLNPGAAQVQQLAEQFATLPTPGFAATIGNLANASNLLESDPTNPVYRDQVVSGINALIAQINAQGNLPSLPQFEALAAAMQGHTSASDIANDLAALRALLTTLLGELQRVAQLGVEIRFAPGAVAVLQNQSSPLTLLLRNRGTQANTYSVTLATANATVSPNALSITANAGEQVTRLVTVSSNVIGVQTLLASAVALSGTTPTDVSDTATAAVNTVDAFVRVLDVRANPAFVETGVSATTVRATIANVPNIARQAVAQLDVLGSGNTLVATSRTTLTIGTGNPQSYIVGNLNTSGYTTGTYTLSLRLLDSADQLVPDSTANGTFVVGRGVEIDHSLSPSIVAPGNVTGTIIITTRVRDGLSSVVDPLLGVTGSTPKGGGKVLAKPRVFVRGGVGITRTEELSLTLQGTWTNQNVARASDGRVRYASVVGASALYTFTGSWFGVGFMSETDGRYAEIFVDGVPVDSGRHLQPGPQFAGPLLHRGPRHARYLHLRQQRRKPAGQRRYPLRVSGLCGLLGRHAAARRRVRASIQPHCLKRLCHHHAGHRQRRQLRLGQRRRNRLAGLHRPLVRHHRAG